MDFKTYIKNWGSNFKNYIIDPQYITDDMRHHITSCQICKLPITLYTICQDKYLSQLFAQQLNWRVPKLYFNGNSDTFTSDVYDAFPNQYVMKTTHGYGTKGVLSVMKNKIVNTQGDPSFMTFKKWMNKKYIICEEYLLGKSSSKYPIDYKCYVFNGIIKYICIVQRALKSASLYTVSFEKKYKFNSISNNICDNFPSDEALKKLKKYCRNLSMFKKLFIRVDFYIINDEVFFGEFTPNPNNGCRYSKEMLIDLTRDIQYLNQASLSISST